MNKIFLLSILMFSCKNFSKYETNFVKNDSTWNVIFYVAADNDLNKHGFYTVRTAIEGYLENSNVNVFFMCDGISTENSIYSEAFYYKLEKEGLVKIESKGIVDSGSIDSFKQFIDFISDNYNSADYNALFLWGHGSSIPTLGYKSAKDDVGIFLFDYNVNKEDKKFKRGLSFNELVEAIKYFSCKLNNKKLDILGLDACSLMNVEIAYEIRDYVHFLIASQIKQNALSWNYRDVLNYLFKNSPVLPSKVVDKLFWAYQDFYEFKMYNLPYYNQAFIDNRQNDAISVLDLTHISSFHIVFEEYIKYILDSLNSTLSESLKRDMNKIFIKKEITKDQHFVDMKYIIELNYMFFKNQNIPGLNNLEVLYDKVCKKFNELVILNYNREKVSELKGLSIRYRISKENLNYLFGYKQWTRFLKVTIQK